MRNAALLVSLLASACLMPPAQSGTGSTYATAPSGGGGGESTSSETSSMGSPSATTAAAPAAPAGPVSVTIRSACSNTVKVFFGDKPKFGSGTYSTISSNSVQSHSFRQGDMLWIVDESENGVASATVSGSTRELEIGSGCTSINTR